MPEVREAFRRQLFVVFGVVAATGVLLVALRLFRALGTEERNRRVYAAAIDDRNG